MSTSDTFHAAARRADVAELSRLLRVDPSLARSRDAGGRTALHHLAGADASRGGEELLAGLALLRAHDAVLDDVNPKSGLTPLHRAVMSGNSAFALALVEAGASVSVTSAKERRTAGEMCRDGALREELLSRARAVVTAAAQRAAGGAPGAPGAGASAAAAPHAMPHAAAAAAAVEHAPAAAAGGAARTLSGEGVSNAPPDGAAAGFSGAAPPPACDAFASMALAPPPEEAQEAAQAQQPAAVPPQHARAPNDEGDADVAARSSRLRRRLVLPDAAAAAALADAWWRIAGALPGAGAPLPRSDALLRLAFRGVPPAARAQIWPAAAGVDALRAALAGAGISYASLVRAAAGGGHLPEETAAQIDKDVRRSGVAFSGAAAAGAVPAALRRMLRALAVLDPVVGYCQSENSLAAACLLVLGAAGADAAAAEEQAFILTLAVARCAQPAGYYGGSLSGARRDAAVVAAALCRRRPALCARLGGADAAHSLLSAFILPWLMTAFVGTAPLELALRIWDAMLLAGQESLLRCAFVLLDERADAAAAARDDCAAADVLAGAAAALAGELTPARIDGIMEAARTMRWPLHDPAAAAGVEGGEGGGGAAGGLRLPGALADALAAVEARVEAAGGAAGVRAAAAARGSAAAAAGARAARGAVAALRQRFRKSRGGDDAQHSDDDGDGADTTDEPPSTDAHHPQHSHTHAASDAPSAAAAPASPEAAAASAAAALAAAGGAHLPRASHSLEVLRREKADILLPEDVAASPLPLYLFAAAAAAAARRPSAEEAAEGIEEAVAAEKEEAEEEEEEGAAARELLGPSGSAGTLRALRAWLDASL
jgi:ankyrin repeat protein